MKDEADARGAVLTESGPSGQTLDASAMIQQIQQAVANKVDGVVTFPASEGFTEVLKQAQSAGVLTGTLYGPGGADSGADVNAGPDWGDIGAQLVNAVSALPGDHVLGLVAQGDTGLGKLWLDGVKAAAAATDNVTIGGEVYTGDDASKALPQVTALLTAHPDVTEIVTHMGTTTPGAVAAIKALGLEGKTFLLAGGHDNGGTEAVQEGTANLMMLVDLCTLGKQMVDGMVDVHNGQPAPEIPVKIAVVGKDEIQGYLDKGWT
jgi:ABC-type sugar transport system substrate-binding protein